MTIHVCTIFPCILVSRWRSLRPRAFQYSWIQMADGTFFFFFKGPSRDGHVWSFSAAESLQKDNSMWVRDAVRWPGRVATKSHKQLCVISNIKDRKRWVSTCLLSARYSNKTLVKEMLQKRVIMSLRGVPNIKTIPSLPSQAEEPSSV